MVQRALYGMAAIHRNADLKDQVSFLWFGLFTKSVVSR